MIKLMIKASVILTGMICLCLMPFVPLAVGNRVVNNPGAGGGPTYLVSEDCEGTDTPPGWTDAGAFPPDWDETTLAIEGAQSVEFPTSSHFTRSPIFAVTSPCYAFFRVRVGEASGNIDIFRLTNSEGEIASVQYRSTTGVFRVEHGSVTAQTADLGDAGIYNVWLDYTLGTGANGTAELRITLGGDLTRPVSATATITTGTSTVGADQLYFAGHANIIVADRIRADDEVIGSNPP